MGWTLGQQAPDQVQAVGATLKGQRRFVRFYPIVNHRPLVSGDVGEVGDDEVDGLGEGQEQVALVKGDGAGDVMAGGVAPGDGKGGRRDVDGVEGKAGLFSGEGDGDAAATGADVDGRGARPLAQPCEGSCDE